VCIIWRLNTQDPTVCCYAGLRAQVRRNRLSSSQVEDNSLHIREPCEAPAIAFDRRMPEQSQDIWRDCSSAQSSSSLQQRFL